MKRINVHPHISRSAAAIIIIGVLVLFVSLFLRYKTAQLIKYVVDTETNGRYHLNIEKLNVSIFNRSVEIKNAVIEQKDSGKVNSNLIIILPELKIQIRSWRSLVIDRKLFIDSLILFSPSAEFFSDTNQQQINSGYRSQQIASALHEIVELLNIKSFKLVGGKFFIPYKIIPHCKLQM
jgi:hypothetical protein